MTTIGDDPAGPSSQPHAAMPATRVDEPDEPEGSDDRATRLQTMTALVLTQGVSLSLFVGWFGIVTLAVLGVVTPQAIDSVAATTALYVLWLYPLPLLVGIVASWLLYRQAKYQLAAVATFLPLLYATPFALLFIATV